MMVHSHDPKDLNKLAPHADYRAVTFVDAKICCGHVLSMSSEPTAHLALYMADIKPDGSIEFRHSIVSDLWCPCDEREVSMFSLDLKNIGGKNE